MDRVVSIIRDCANGKYNEQPIIVNMQGSQVSGSIFGPVTKMGMNIMEIDLHGSVITGSVFDKVIKNGNEIHITVSPSPNSFLDNPDWNQLEKEIQALLKQIHPDGQEARTVKSLLKPIKNKNVSKLIELIKNGAKELTSKVIVSLAGNYLSQFIQSVISGGS